MHILAVAGVTGRSVGMQKVSFSIILQRAGTYYFKMTIVSTGALPLLLKPPLSIHSGAMC